MTKNVSTEIIKQLQRGPFKKMYLPGLDALMDHFHHKLN